jgi:hypothetical protein
MTHRDTGLCVLSDRRPLGRTGHRWLDTIAGLDSKEVGWDGPVKSFCQHGSEHSGFMKDKAFSD